MLTALVILMILFCLFIIEAFPPFLTAVIGMVMFALFGYVSVDDAMAGFGNSGLITIVLMFVISQAFLQTGALQFLTTKYYQHFKKNFYFSFWIFMSFIGIISSFMNNTPIVAMFIPVIYQLSQMSGIPATKMLIPLSFVTIMGGMNTILGTSTNLIVNEIIAEHQLKPFGIFDFTLPAFIMMIFGLFFIIYFGTRLLPNRNNNENKKDIYNLEQYIAEIKISDDQYLAGQRIMDSDLVKSFEMEIIQLKRDNTVINIPPGDFILQKGDILRVKCNINKIKDLKDKVTIIKNDNIQWAENPANEKSNMLVEFIITADSDLENKTLKDSDFRHSFRAIPIAIRQRKGILNEGIYHTPLKAGDVILAEIKPHYLKELQKLEQIGKLPFIIKSSIERTDFQKQKFFLLLGMFIIVLLLATLKFVPLIVGLFALLPFIYFSKIMNEKDMIKSVNWSLYLMIGALFSWGKAMENAGITDTFSHFINNISILNNSPMAVMAVLFLTSMILTEFITNNAVAILMTPVAIGIANNMGLNYQPFVLAVLFASSCSFLTPIGYQTNTMVYMAGNYKFIDFVKVGFILSLIYFILTLTLIPLFFPF